MKATNPSICYLLKSILTLNYILSRPTCIQSYYDILFLVKFTFIKNILPFTSNHISGTNCSNPYCPHPSQTDVKLPVIPLYYNFYIYTQAIMPNQLYNIVFADEKIGNLANK